MTRDILRVIGAAEECRYAAQTADGALYAAFYAHDAVNAPISIDAVNAAQPQRGGACDKGRK